MSNIYNKDPKKQDLYFYNGMSEPVKLTLEDRRLGDHYLGNRIGEFKENYDLHVNGFDTKDLQKNQPFLVSKPYNVWVNPAKWQLEEYNIAEGMEPNINLDDFEGVGELNELTRSFNFIEGASVEDYLNSNLNVALYNSHDGEKLNSLKSSLDDLDITFSGEIHQNITAYFQSKGKELDLNEQKHNHEIIKDIIDHNAKAPVIETQISKGKHESGLRTDLVSLDNIENEETLKEYFNKALSVQAENDSVYCQIESFDSNRVYEQVQKRKNPQLEQDHEI